MDHAPLPSLRSWLVLLAVSLLAAGPAGCDDPPKKSTADLTDAARSDGDGANAPLVTYTEERAECAQRNPLRNAYFGDLHVHTHYSFDAWVEGTRPGPAEAYAFAKGAAIRIPPLDASGAGTQTVQLGKPLDFAAVTDHAEFIGEVESCTTAGAPGYEHARCVAYRDGDPTSFTDFGVQLTREQPQRLDLCDDIDCLAAAGSVWAQMQQAADEAYDRTAACTFTAFVGYEWSSNTAGRNLHRNVLFRNDEVPSTPTSYFEEPTPEGLWAALRRDCLDADGGCDVLAIPHNSNLSNGGMFAPIYAGAASLEDERWQAQQRAALEPVMEIFQHKGNSECNNGFAGVFGDPDELCAVEAVRPAPFDDCGDELGALGIQGVGCVSRYDYARTTLLAGLQEQVRLGVNPYALGFIGSTDTHNATPGATDESSYLGHTGGAEALPDDRLKRQPLVPFSIVANPGGLAGVWAVENSRDALFEAIRRREVFGTSGTRIVVRFFGGWTFADALCGQPDLVAQGYAQGVSMGGELPERSGAAAPRFVVQAAADPDARPLQQLQIVKGWLAADGPHYAVYTVAGDANNGATVAPDTCEPQGTGSDGLCGVWADPTFDPAQPAFYYARVVENPSCRWSRLQCLALDPANRPAACDDPSVPTTIREMAWASPIWYRP